MRRIITHPVVKSFAYLRHVPNLDILFDILIKACDALDRAHDRGIIVGDIKWGNILIDTSLNPIFIDTDNYAFANFGFDVRPNVTYRLEEIFEEEFSYYDNDQFLLAYMVMRELFSYHGITFMDTMTSFEKAMDYINIDNSSKDELKAIFSNEHDKPSIGPILKRVKNRDKFINVPSNASFNLLF